MRTMNRRIGAALIACALAAAACDTKVVNPGPVQDTFLDQPAAQVAVVSGMGRALAEAINWIAYTGAAVAREIHPAGSIGSFGITPAWQRGELEEGDEDLDTHWEEAQQARWYAENGIKRMLEVVPDSTRLIAQANLWAGYANRLLGDNMCDAVIDGGPRMPHTEYYRRAEEYFTAAMNAGTGNVRTAALAGRASARVGLGKWPEAVADAEQVPKDFVYQIPYFDVGQDAQRNRVQWSVANLPYRAHTQWSTWVAEYFDATGDQRVKYRKTNLLGDAAVTCCGSPSFRTPFYPQDKYTTPASPVTLSSGAEMQLIRAEALLRNQDFAGAIGLINDVRQRAGAPLVTASTLKEAWTLLKRERAIVLWLEARRLGDLRRWKAEGTPGDLHPLEVPSGSVNEGSHLVRQDLCFPVSKSEIDTNPNIS